MLKTDSSDEISDSLRFTISGILFNIHGGWLLLIGVHVGGNVSGLHKRVVFAAILVKGYIQVIDYLFVCFDCYL